VRACVNHPDRPGKWLCQKFDVAYCDECCRCGHAEGYCKFRSQCGVRQICEESNAAQAPPPDKSNGAQALLPGEENRAQPRLPGHTGRSARAPAPGQHAEARRCSSHTPAPAPSRQALPLAKPARAAYRRNLPHLQPADKTFFVTFATHGRWQLPEAVRQAVIEHCLHDDGVKISVHGVVVMPDHVHMIFTPLRDDNGNVFGLAEIMRGIKGASARNINRLLGRSGRVWQEECFDRILRSSESARTKVEYICDNPVREGLVQAQDDYPWLWREWAEGQE